VPDQVDNVLIEVQKCLNDITVGILDAQAASSLSELNNELACSDLSKPTAFHKLFAEIHWTQRIASQLVDANHASSIGVVGMFAGMFSALAGQEISTEEALIEAIAEGHVGDVKDCLMEWPDICTADENGDQPIHLSCYINNAQILRTLLSTPGVHANARSENGQNTPLHIAMDRNHLPNIRQLLMHGADPSRKNEYNMSPLDLARGEKARRAVQQVNPDARPCPTHTTRAAGPLQPQPPALNTDTHHQPRRPPPPSVRPARLPSLRQPLTARGPHGGWSSAPSPASSSRPPCGLPRAGCTS
jgi:hypothetical protein